MRSNISVNSNGSIAGAVENALEGENSDAKTFELLNRLDLDTIKHSFDKLGMESEHKNLSEEGGELNKVGSTGGPGYYGKSPSDADILVWESGESERTVFFSVTLEEGRRARIDRPAPADLFAIGWNPEVFEPASGIENRRAMLYWDGDDRGTSSDMRREADMGPSKVLPDNVSGVNRSPGRGFKVYDAGHRKAAEADTLSVSAKITLHKHNEERVGNIFGVYKHTWSLLGVLGRPEVGDITDATTIVLNGKRASVEFDLPGVKYDWQITAEYFDN